MDNFDSQTEEPLQDSNMVDEEDLGFLEDVAVEEEMRDGVSQPASKKQKTSTKRSKHWLGFKVVEVFEGDPPVKVQKGECNTCGKLIAADSKNCGTNGLKKHREACNKRKERASGQAQTMLNYQAGSGTDGTGPGSLTNWKFDQVRCRMKLCEMIIRDELPFRFVERMGFKEYSEALCPQFKIPGRHTIRADCVKLFLERKISMKSFFQTKGMGRASITTDCWTSINNTNFICVTAHFIDKDWRLHKKIISFSKILGHKGDDIGAAIISSLEDWGLQKVLCCTMDNASANEVAIKFMKPIFESWGTSLAGGKYIHMRCVAHIINLIVSDGLEEIGQSVRRLRETVKWIKASPARTQEFMGAVQVLKIDCSKSLCLDVPTRWNSTYLMLEAALPYEKPLLCWHFGNRDFTNDMNQKKYKNGVLGVLQAADFLNATKMCDYLCQFYDLTLLVSGTTYTTSHLFFKEMCELFDLISGLELDEDDEVSSMAKRMKTKLGKYWLEEFDMNPRMNRILYVAAVLDPRQKMMHVDKCLKVVYGEDRAAELVGEVKSSLDELFQIYKKNAATTLPPVVNTSPLQHPHTSTDRSDRRGLRVKSSLSQLRIGEAQPTATISEIDLYLSESQYVMDLSEADSFDILLWWSRNSPRLPVMSEIARDVLAIPISSVASECAFSTGGRVLSQFRSSLTCNMVEALICAQDWLKSSSVDKFLNDEEDVPETEMEKEYDNGEYFFLNIIK